MIVRRTPLTATKAVSLAAVATVACVLAAAALQGVTPTSSWAARVQPAAVLPMPDITPSGVAAESISLDQQLADGTRVHWTAQRVLRRKRSSVLFHYENYAELVVSGLRIELHVSGSSSAREVRAPMIVLREAIEDLRLGVDEAEPGASADASGVLAAEDAGSEQLSRVIVEDLRIIETTDDGPLFELNASSARLAGGDAALVFEGLVRIRSGADQVDANLAGWLTDRSALLVRDAHRFGGGQVTHSALYALPGTGIEPLDGDAPDVAFEDAFDSLEKRLIDKLAGHASGPLALMLTGRLMR